MVDTERAFTSDDIETTLAADGSEWVPIACGRNNAIAGYYGLGPHQVVYKGMRMSPTRFEEFARMGQYAKWRKSVRYVP